jgi:protease PrsW
MTAVNPPSPPAVAVSAEPERRRWGAHVSFIQPRQPAFWLFIVLVALGSLYVLFEQLIYVLNSPVGWFVSWLLLLGYMVPVLLVIRWLDLYEPEPPSLMVAAFAWGATVAIPFSVLGNMSWGAVISRLGGVEFAAYWSGALTAPLVEEIYKYLGLVLLYLIARAEFDDLMDGFVYGALIGLGFSVVEDVGYFMTHFGGDVGGVILGFFVRTIAAGLYGHVLFSGLAGVGFAYFVTHRLDRPLGRRLFIAGGLLLLAIGAHFFWNAPWLWPQEGDLGGLLVAVTIKGLPFLIALFVLLRLARLREHDALVEALRGEVGREGLLSDELEQLRTPGRRREAVRRVAGAAGAEAARLLKRLHHAQIALAVMAARIDSPAHADLVRQRALIHALRGRLWLIPGVVEALGYPRPVIEAALGTAAPALWVPDVRVAPAGGWAWATPNYEDPRRGALVPGMPLQVVEQTGNWLLVRADNGWVGWTDARYLYPTTT